jgi:predicted extracellular nuclease
MRNRNRLACATLACAAAVLGSSLASRGATLVINEVYGGGGNSGSTYKNDFIELYNSGPTAVDLTGYKLQYASTTGPYDALTLTATSDTSTANSFLSGSIQPGAFYLVGESQGAGGTTDLPSPDYTDPSPIAMSATGAKVRLVDASFNIVDRVGWGGANDFEGTVGPTTANTTSAQRFPNGFDSDNNAADFKTAFPTPRAVNTPEPAAAGVFAVAGLLCLRRRRR